MTRASNGDTPTQIPRAGLRVLREGQWQRIVSDELLGSTTSVLFALPGAFTPTCSAQHLPRYEELAPLIRSHGVDQVLCLAVNDPYVMARWGREQGLREVVLVSDGNGEFSRKMGMLLDQSDQGMGRRSRRYSMLVRRGRIEKLFAEPQQTGDPYTVSDADTLLDWLAPRWPHPPRIAMLTQDGCPHCAQARQLLGEHRLGFEELKLDDARRSRVLGAIAGALTTPQVFIDGQRIGGCDELQGYLGSRSALDANRTPTRRAAA